MFKSFKFYCEKCDHLLDETNNNRKDTWDNAKTNVVCGICNSLVVITKPELPANQLYLYDSLHMTFRHTEDNRVIDINSYLEPKFKDVKVDVCIKCGAPAIPRKFDECLSDCIICSSVTANF